MKIKTLFIPVLVASFSFMNSAFAQQVKIMTVMRGDDTVTVFADTLNDVNKNPAAVFFDDDFRDLMIDIDSFLQANMMNMEDMMKALPFQTDSLSKMMGMFASDPDDDLFNNAMLSDSLLKEMMDVDMQINIDTLEDGRTVKKIVVIGGDEGDSHKIIKNGNQYIIVSGSDDEREPEFEPEDIVAPVPASDLHLLKKAGFSANLLTSEPLEFKQKNINIEHKETNDTDILEFELKATLPSKDKTTVTLIDKNSSRTDEENFKNTEKINIKYKLDEASAPYYLLIVQNKKLWSRKLDF